MKGISTPVSPLVALFCALVFNASLVAGLDIVGSVIDSSSGRPLSGATVRILGIGTDTTTSTGEFRIATPGSMVGHRITYQVYKEGWTLQTSQALTIIVPASPTDNPLRVYMAKAGRSLGFASSGGISADFSFLPPDEPTATDRSNGDAIDRAEALFDVSYVAYKDQHGIQAKPKIGYLELLDSGGPIRFHFYHYTPFEMELPELDIKIVNNTHQTLFLTEADFQVEQSALDPSPILIIPRTGHHMAMHVENFGWSKLRNPKFSFNLLPFGLQPDSSEDDNRHEMENELFDEKTSERVYKDALANTLPIEEDEDGEIDLDFTSVLGSLGVDVSAIENAGHELTDGAYPEQLRKACGQFVGCAAMVVGEMVYDDPTRKRKSVKLLNILFFGPPGKGKPRPPSFRYSVKLDVDGKDYVKKVPLSQTLEQGEADRFTIKIAAERSSQHYFRVKLLSTDGRVVESPPVSLNLFMPRRTEKYLTDEIRKASD